MGGGEEMPQQAGGRRGARIEGPRESPVMGLVTSPVATTYCPCCCDVHLFFVPLWNIQWKMTLLGNSGYEKVLLRK